MSNATIDERVVEMRFDNREFERNVQTTMRSLDDLKRGLNLTESAKSLEEVGRVTRSFSLDGIATGVETIQSKFSAMSVVAITALANITNSAIQAGKNIVSALTIDPIKTGFQEYELKMGSIQTIMASTGESLETVNKYLNELNEYSDQTIYSFSDMTQNIGKFTNAGVKLDVAVAAMQGISNEAALAGANANEASRAMYNFAQALSVGYVQRIDWKSIELANMATVGFKEELIKTAMELGTVVKKGNKYITTTTNMQGKTSELIELQAMFTEGLSHQWLSNDVLLQTLAKYSDETTELGQNAIKAATELKTFTQMMSTLKESAQSGWAQTWEHLVGNFDEAKKLWTDMENVIGGMIDASTKARNDLIEGWKGVGGRAMIIEALRNAFDGLMSVVTLVKETFREIFPKTEVKDLLQLSGRLRAFSKSLVLSSDQAENLRTTFKGLFAALDLGVQAFKAVSNAIKPLFGYTSTAINGILEFTATIGNYLLQLHTAAVETDFFNEVVGGFVDIMTKTFGGVRVVVNSVMSSFKDFSTVVKPKIDSVITSLQEFIAWLNTKIDFANIMESVLGVIGNLHARLKDIIDVMGGLREAVRDIFTQLVTGTVWTTVTDGVGSLLYILQQLWNFLCTVSGGIVKALSGVVTSLGDTLANANYENIFDLINGGLLAGFLVQMNMFAEGLNDFTDVFEGMQMRLKADALLKLGGAIAVLAGSLLVISMIDSEKLFSSLVGITGLFADLSGSMMMFNTFNSIGKGTASTIAMMLGISVSVLILAGAMKKLSSLDWKNLDIGIIAITDMMASLLISAKLLSNSTGGIVSGAAGLVIFAVAIKSLVKTLKSLSDLNWDELGVGLAGVGGLLAELAIFLKITDLDGMSISSGVGVLLLASALSIMSNALEDIGVLNWEQIAKGLVGIGALLVELAAFTKVMGDSKVNISTATSMVVIGAAIKIFASAVGDFSKLNWEQIGKGLAGFAGTLGLIALAMKIMPTNTAGIAAGLVIVGAAMKILASALSDFGRLSPEEFIKGLSGIGILLGEIALAMNLMNGTLSGAAALLVVSAALSALAPALALLGKMDGLEIAKSLGTLAGVFVILGVAGAVLGPLVPALAGLAGSIILIGGAIALTGAGFLAMGAGLTLLAGGLMTLAAIGTAGAVSIVGALTIIITGIANLIPLIIMKIGEGIVALAQVIITGAPILAQAAVTVILSIIDALVQSVPALVAGLLTLISSVLTTLAEHGPVILESVLNIIISILAGIAAKLPEFLQAGVDLIGNLIMGIGGMLSDACKAAKDLMDDIKASIVAKVDEFKEAGKNIIDGVVQGIRSKISDAIAAAREMASSALSAAKEFLGINSPSKAFAELGKWSGVGYVKTLAGFASDAARAGTDVGKSAVSAMSNTLSKISESVENEMDASPTIRPILDLSDIESGAKRISTIFGHSQALSIASGMRTDVTNGNPKNTQSGGGNVYNFTQNNSSPKALSRVEIYRQTKNQFSALKEVLGT